MSMPSLLAWTVMASVAAQTPAEPGAAAPAPAPAPAAESAPQPMPAPDPYLRDPYARPAPGPQPDPYLMNPYAAPKPAKVPGKKLMIAGWSVFGGGYVMAALFGGLIHDGGQPKRGGFMFIPVVGPFIGAFYDDPVPASEDMSLYYERNSGYTMYCLVAGVAQLAGLAMGIAGTVLYTRHRKAQALTMDGVHLGRRVYLNAGAAARRWSAQPERAILSRARRGVQG